MLIFNHKKEFLGIDDEDLKHLGLNSLTQLLSECTNFADLFVKKPGYIHNFKNFEWIDFVLHAEAEESKAIVHVRDKSFSCNIVIDTFYLTKDPSEVAFRIKLQQIRELNALEGAEIAKEVAANPRPKGVAPVAINENTLETPKEVDEPLVVDIAEKADVLPSFDEAETTVLQTADPYDVAQETTFDPYAKETLNVDEDVFSATPTPFTPEDNLDVFKDEEPFKEIPKEIIEVEKSPEIQPMLGDYINKEDDPYLNDLKVPEDYKYNPNVAAEELGLPVDLIEEFIGDFIQQSYEFKDELHTANTKEDLDEVKILSHKLKGVAANLRIEDAFEVLAIINTSDSSAEIEAHLKHFYVMIAKLEGKDTTQEIASIMQNAANEDNTDSTESLDEIDLSIQEENTSIEELEEVIAPIETPLESFENTTNNDENEDEDIYDFDFNTHNESKEEEVELPPMPTLDDNEEEDIYSFDLSNQSSSSDESDDLYDVGLKQPEDGPLLVMEEELNKNNKEDNFLSSFDDEDSFSSSDVLSTPEEEFSVPEAPAVVATINYDTALASAEIGLPQALVVELINDFKIDVNETKESFQEAIDASDTRSWQSIALKHKGVADNLRIIELAPTILAILKADNAQDAQTKITELYGLVEQL